MKRNDYNSNTVLPLLLPYNYYADPPTYAVFGRIFVHPKHISGNIEIRLFQPVTPLFFNINIISLYNSRT